MAVGHLVTLPDRPLFNCCSSPHGEPEMEASASQLRLSRLGQGNVSILKTTTMRGKWQKFWVSRGQQQQHQSPKEPRTVAGGEGGAEADAEAEAATG